MLTDHEIVTALMSTGTSHMQAMGQLREYTEFIRANAVRSKARRDAMATAALQGLLIQSAGPDGKPVDFAQGAVAHADALIAELDKCAA
jgi:hypothetical protein